MARLDKTICGILAASLLTLSATAAWANPTEYIKKKTDVVTKTLEKPDSKGRQGELQKILDETIDFSELAARSLGEHWAKRTDEEKQEFLTLLRDLLQANYEGKLEGQTLGKDYEIKYTAEKEKGERAIVKTSVVAAGESKPVEYKLMKKGGDWTIYDVVIDDISLEETYRESYTEIIEKEGWESLISRMKKKAAELRTEAKAAKPDKKEKAAAKAQN